jgi:hypothetical protein
MITTINNAQIIMGMYKKIGIWWAFSGGIIEDTKNRIIIAEDMAILATNLYVW